MKRWHRDFIDTFKGTFALLFITTVILAGFLGMAGGSVAVLATLIALLPAITIVSVVLSLFAAIHVNT